MSEVNNNISFEEIKEFFILLDPQIMTYSYEIRENFKLFKTLCLNYNIELQKYLILSRQIDLIEFFTVFERSLLYINGVFIKIQNEDTRKYLQNEIKKYRKYNLDNIIKYIHK